MNFLFLNSPYLIHVGLAAIRIGIGLLFVTHGYIKLMGGTQQWMWLGQQMSLFGITFAPIFWGLCATLTEFLGGICLTLGFCTRLAAFLLALVMIVAITYLIAKGDGLNQISSPLSDLIVFIGLIIAGGGIYSLDHYFFAK